MVWNKSETINHRHMQRRDLIKYINVEMHWNKDVCTQKHTNADNLSCAPLRSDRRAKLFIQKEADQRVHLSVCVCVCTLLLILLEHKFTHSLTQLTSKKRVHLYLDYGLDYFRSPRVFQKLFATGLQSHFCNLYNDLPQKLHIPTHIYLSIYYVGLMRLEWNFKTSTSNVVFVLQIFKTAYLCY